MEVAVLIATYNGANYVKELLDSLARQTYRDFRCYIHDDGSTDGTREMLNSYAQTGRIDMEILEYPSTGSAKANFMSMLRYVEEPYVMFCDQDDVWVDNKIEKSLEAIKKIETKDKPALVFSDLYVVDSRLDIISDSFMEYSGFDPSRINFNELLIENVAPGCTMIANRVLCNIAKQLDDCSNILMHDHWLMILAAGTGSIGYINEPLIMYRQHDHNEAGAAEGMALPVRLVALIKRMMSNDYKEFIDNWLGSLQKQARAASLIPELPENRRELCIKFALINNSNKVKRIRFYMKNKLYRGSYNLWMLIWC